MSFRNAMLASVLGCMIALPAFAQSDDMMADDSMVDDIMDGVVEKASANPSATMDTNMTQGDDMISLEEDIMSGTEAGATDLSNGMMLDDMMKTDAPADMMVAEEPEQAKSFYMDLFGDSSYEISANIFGYAMGYTDPTINDDKLAAWVGFEMRNSADLAEGVTLNYTLNAIFDSDQSSQGVFRSPHQKSRSTKAVDFSELYLVFEQDSSEITIGKAEFSQGVAELVSPTNHFNSGYSGHPIQAKDYGAWHARFDYFIGDDTATFAIFPFDAKGTSFSDHSRWAGTQGTYSFADIPADTNLQTEYYGPNFENWGALLKYKAVRHGYDYFVSGYVGRSPNAIADIRVDGLNTRNYVVNPKAMILDAGFASTVDRWKLYTEGSLQKVWNDYDEDLLKYVVGFSYRDNALAAKLGLEEIMPIVEYAGEWVFDETLNLKVLADSAGVRGFRDAIVSRVRFKVDSDLTFNIGASHNFVDKDRYATLGMEYKYSDDLKFHALLTHFEGETDTQFGRWTRNDNLRIGLDYKF